jgi:hypothetical protein
MSEGFNIKLRSPRICAGRNLFFCGVTCAFLLFATTARPQPLTFSTWAGYAGQVSTNGTGGAARFAFPTSVAVDTASNIYVADFGNNTVRKITPAGTVTTLAGNAGVSGSANGTGTNALFNQPAGVAVDSAGNVYVADYGNSAIRKITQAGVVSTLAGSAGNPGSANGTGTNAFFNQPCGVAVDSAGNVYVADYGNQTIRKITSAGVTSTLAGSVGNFGSTDATGTNALFYEPEAVAVDNAGNVYVADTANATIRKITPAGAVTTIAGFAGNFGSTNGTGTNAQFYQPEGVAVDSATNLYVADYFNNTIRKITPGGAVTTLVGATGQSGNVDGSGTNALFSSPEGIAADISGKIYVADAGNGTIRIVTSSGQVTTLAGSPSNGSADGSGVNARFSLPQGVAVDTNGNAYVADSANHTIRKITSLGAVSTFAGQVGTTGSADGSGTNAGFYRPQGVAVDKTGNVYVADSENNTIRKITPAGMVSTFAGFAAYSGVADGQGTNARFFQPEAIVVDGAGNLYVSDTWNFTIRKITPGGMVTTLGGSAGYQGSADGTNSSARFFWPEGIAVDAATNIYVADSGNHTIREITPGGMVSTVAGTAGLWGNADGTNGNARFLEPTGIALDSSGNLLVTDSGNHAIRKITPNGTNWIVSTVAGLTGVAGFSDGTGTNAQFCYPGGIAVDASGYVYVADAGNNTIRLDASAFPVILSQPQSQTVIQGTNVSLNVVAGGTPVLNYQWLLNGTNTTNVGSSYVFNNVQAGQSGAYSVIISNGLGSVTSSVATLTVLVPPAIISQPQSQSVPPGGGATFTVTATGTAPLSYQWQYNGSGLGPGTNTFTAHRAGSYSVVVSNLAGTVMSDTATLSFSQAPSFQSIGLLADGSVQLQMSGEAGSNYFLEYTSNWIDWTTLTNLSSTNGALQYDDASATNGGRRFYRLQLAP